MVQQNCSWPTFYQMDFMEKYIDMLLKVDYMYILFRASPWNGHWLTDKRRG